MEPSSTELNGAYVDPKDRVLDPSLIEQSLIERMPQPTGWRILILPYRGKGKTEGGILLPDKIVEYCHQRKATVLLLLSNGGISHEQLVYVWEFAKDTVCNV